MSFTDVQEVLSTEQEDPGHFTLPPHLRCASHTLNLISTVDTEKWLTVTNKTIYRSATAKCSALWTKASRSTVAAELVESLCGKKLMVPTVTRWNSFHNAVARITDIQTTVDNSLQSVRCTSLFRARVQIPCRVLHSHKTAYKSFGPFTK